MGLTMGLNLRALTPSGSGLERHTARTPRDPRRVPLRRGRPGLRRLASAGLAAAALAAALQVLAPDPAAGVPAVVLARDLAAGAVIGADDLQTVQVPATMLPRGAVRVGQASGHLMASAGRSGEVLTDARLVGPGLLVGQNPGRVAAPVRVADPAAAALAWPGDRVDVLLATAGRADAEVVVRAATVLARPPAPTSGSGLLGADTDLAGGGLLVLAVGADEAAALAGAAARGALSITLR